MSRTTPEEITRIADRVTELGVQEAVFYTLHHTGELFPCSVPASLTKAVEPLDRSVLTEYGLHKHVRGDLPVKYGPLGRSRLRGPHENGLGRSHDARWAAVAVAEDRSVGIDVQSPPEQVPERFLVCCPTGPTSGADGAEAVLARTALDQLGHLPMARPAPKSAWFRTARETCAKAAGTGLGGAP
ncbi:4'-phosphopantetheinyl transferase family protein [Streptomyces anulatus]|uniref:hypothetical protein n=1 Tax=Streptomyces anulatus TaxID=1892 RepID=UPI00363085A9